VEDQPLIRSSTARVLERYGYHVLTAQDGALALAILREGQPRVNLVITDVIMPNLSGGIRIPFLDAKEAGRAVVASAGRGARRAVACPARAASG